MQVYVNQLVKMSLPGIFIVTMLTLSIPAVHGGKVLVFPQDGSNWVNMKVIIEALHSRGHSVSVVRPSDSWYIKETSPHYSSITIDIPGGADEEFFRSFVSRLIQIKREGKFFEIHRKVCEMIIKMLENKQLMQSIRETKYDLVLTDPANGGGVVLAHYLNVPLVFNVRWTIRGEGHFAIAPSPLSYVPFPVAELTDKMSFFERVLNIVVYVTRQYLYRQTMGPHYSALVALVLRSTTSHCFKLSGVHGVIIMSLGTLIGQLPHDISDEIAAAFSQLPQKVIWRYKGDRPATLGNNTLLVDWMPQDDFLGHPMTRLFVAHGGTNGIFEAIYHGVPIVGLPLVFDQPDNLSRMKVKGVAKVVDLATLDRNIFSQALQEVLNEPSYRRNMQRLSRLHRDVPMEPLDTALFWVEFVMRHKGAAHLHTESYRMPWFSYHSVDVMVFLLAVVSFTLLITVAFIRCLCFRMCSRHKIKHK
uniref:UDP glucuronosyltransferase 5 family, polypeptide F1 n=1 Tax=Salmo trutta TaxID=8032 RepID=A0A673XTM9_SALTR